MSARGGGPASPGAAAGMSLRDYFAGQALAGILANPNNETAGDFWLELEDAADVAYLYAESMLKRKSATK